MSAYTIRYFISQMLWLYEMLIFAYAVMSWFRGMGGAAVAIYGFLSTVCEPFVGAIRRLLPASISGGAGVDASPMVAILILIVLQNIIR